MATTAEIKAAIRSRLIAECGMTEPPPPPVGELPKYGLAFYHSYIMVDELYAGFDWSDDVEGFHDFSSGTPGSPLMFERWISTVESGSFQKDYIYEWDGIQWAEIEQRIGKPYWIKSQGTHRYFDGEDWVQLTGSEGTTDHTNLENLNSEDYWHLTQSEYHAFLLLPAAIAYKENAGVAAGLVGEHETRWDHDLFLTELPEHNHDDRYYTESEITILLSGKENAGTAAGLIATHESTWDHDAFLTSLPSHNHPWAEITGKPSVFTPAAHDHDSVYAKLSLGTISLSGFATSLETDRIVFAPGIYSYRFMSSAENRPDTMTVGSVLTWGVGVQGAGQLAIGWTAGEHNTLMFRSLRDTTDPWWPWKRIYHTGYKPTPDDIGAAPVIHSHTASHLPGNIVYTDNAQTVTGVKTFNPNTNFGNTITFTGTNKWIISNTATTDKNNAIILGYPNAANSGYVGVHEINHATRPGEVVLQAGGSNGAIYMSPRAYFGTRPANDHFWQLAFGDRSTITQYTDNNFHLSYNAYYDGANWRRRVSGIPNYLMMNVSGQFVLRTGSTGAADSVIDPQIYAICSANGNTAFGKNGFVGGYRVEVEGSVYASENIVAGSVNSTSNRLVRVTAGDNYLCGFEAYGNNQGTGYLYVGQSFTYGGGLYYHGDATPVFATGEVVDAVNFYRKNNGVNEVVFYYPYGTNNVVYRGSIKLTDGYGYLNLYNNSGQGRSEIKAHTNSLILSVENADLGSADAIILNRDAGTMGAGKVLITVSGISYFEDTAYFDKNVNVFGSIITSGNISLTGSGDKLINAGSNLLSIDAGEIYLNTYYSKLGGFLALDQQNVGDAHPAFTYLTASLVVINSMSGDSISIPYNRAAGMPLQNGISVRFCNLAGKTITINTVYHIPSGRCMTFALVGGVWRAEFTV